LISEFLRKIGRLLRPLPYGQWTSIEGGLQVRLTPAGHVLGSTIFEVELADARVVVFSGDLGTSDAPLLNPPRADLLVLESTYGDRIRPSRSDRKARLQEVIDKTLDNGGVTIIPAFSLGRTQDLLFELNNILLSHQNSYPTSAMQKVDVIVDSPLAARFTEIYVQMTQFWGAEARTVLHLDDQPLVFENLVTVGSHAEHLDTRLLSRLKTLSAR
jgi:metallo-beta-lactamase family protein